MTFFCYVPTTHKTKPQIMDDKGLLSTIGKESFSNNRGGQEARHAMYRRDQNHNLIIL